MLFRTEKRDGRKTNIVKAPESVELLRIELNPSSNQLCLWLTDRRIASVENIANAELRAQVQILLELLTPEKEELNPTANPTSSQMPEPSQQAVKTEITVSLPEDDLNAPFLTRLTDSLKRQRNYQSIPPIKPPKLKKVVKDPWDTNNADMCTQVNTILQRKLRECPDPLQIELEDNDGELVIRVNGQNHRQIDAVPDECARALIRTAVTEWHTKMLGVKA